MSSRHITISRRQFIQAGAVATASGLVARLEATAPPSQKLHAYSDYGWLRGFNVVPSWGARIEEAWWSYHPDRMREEVSLARQVHANCIRLWIEFSAWMANPEVVASNFMDAIAAIDEAGMKTMPCLFNRWHDNQWDYGGTYTETLLRDWRPQLEYVRALVTPLVNDDRVLLWDLCNEPQDFDLQGEVKKREFSWLSEINATVRGCNPRQPITIGTAFTTTIDAHQPLVDVLCGHPYATTLPGLQELLKGYTAQRELYKKPFLVNESIPGCLDDAARADLAKYYLEELPKAGFGWMGWALREGKAVSTRRDRYDVNGIRLEGFHPFFTKDGKLRSGLEFMKEKPLRSPPWEQPT